MKFLIVTQKVDRNDSVLGFMHTWVEAFSKQVDQLTVICLEKGDYHFSENVRVFSLGKEQGKTRLVYAARLWKYVVQERNNYDAVFVHMNQKYILMAGWLWKLFGKEIGLWYAHGHIPLSLKIAEKVTDHIFTSGQSGFRLKTPKLHVVGQGIDVDAFIPASGQPLMHDTGRTFEIITIGRISPIKDYETLIDAVGQLVKQGKKVHATIIGAAGLKEQESYFEQLKQLVNERKLSNEITFTGPVANKDILPYLHKADVFVNMSHTGSLDKAVLEAMSAGLPVLTCNEAYGPILKKRSTLLLYEKKNAHALADHISQVMTLDVSERIAIGSELRSIVVADHSLRSFVGKILAFYGK